jgi:hypothetical protein
MSGGLGHTTRSIARRKRSSTPKLWRRALNVDTMWIQQCGEVSGIVRFKGQHLESEAKGQRKAHDLQQPPFWGTVFICCKVTHAVTDLILHPLCVFLQDLKTQQISAHLETLQVGQLKTFRCVCPCAGIFHSSQSVTGPFWIHMLVPCWRTMLYIQILYCVLFDLCIILHYFRTNPCLENPATRALSVWHVQMPDDTSYLRGQGWRTSNEIGGPVWFFWGTSDACAYLFQDVMLWKNPLRSPYVKAHCQDHAVMYVLRMQ